MRKWIFAPVAAIVLVAAGCTGTNEDLEVPRDTTEKPVPDAVAASPLRIVDYNVHDFFDDVAETDSGAEVVPTTADYQKKQQAIAAVLTPLAADVVVLAEVENQKVLDDLATGPLASLGYGTRLVLPGNDPRGVNVGVLSRVAFDSAVSHAADSFTAEGTSSPSYRYSRDCLELHLTWGGRPIILLGVHFKAKAPPDDPQKRLAEAQHTRKIADWLAQNAPSAGVAILGDFNDEPGSPALLAVAGAAPSVYVDTASLVSPSSDAWSYDYQGSHQLIDHQMTNPLLAGMLDPKTVTIPHDPSVEAASDHAPIAATYQVR